MDTFLKISLISVASLLIACSSDSGSSTAGVSGSAMPTAKQLLCNEQDCVSQNSGSSVGALTANTAAQEVLTSYQLAKNTVDGINEIIDQFNELAALEGITDCDGLPDSYTLTYGPDNSNELALSNGDLSFDMGTGSNSMDHKLIRTEFGVRTAEFQFKCVSSTEAFVYMHSGVSTTSGIEQVFFHYTATTNAVEYVFKSDSSEDILFRFDENSATGDISFVSIVDSRKSIIKNIEISTLPLIPTLEVAYTTTPGTSLDSVPFGINVGTGDVRTCIYTPQTDLMVESDPTSIGSDCDEAAAEALVPTSDPLVGNNLTKNWDEDFLTDITFPAID